ncbi:PDR/VanB family oxidoreductase [Rhodococcus sp. NPDC056960]|uniref:PDR/VanB family oxidoreductase n=1 Tax=Rhodococcus sp. NPDC056960 TaxID=3345982 RepID=UPI003640E041
MTRLPTGIRHHREDRLVKAIDRLSDRYVQLLHRIPVPDRRAPATPTVVPVVVTDRTVVTADGDVVSLRLEPTAGQRLPAWYPGAHLDLTLPSGRVRQYSLCGDPADPSHYRIAVRRIPDGGGSQEIRDGVRVGTELRTRPPRNAFPLALGGHTFRPRAVRFVAGGIGITPILPMVTAADRLGVEWSLLYTGRTRDSLAFLDRLTDFGNRVRVRCDEDDGIPSAADLLGDLPDSSSVYCCGPAPMIESLRTVLAPRRTIGLHYERFSPPPIVDGAPFEVQLADGTVLDVPADRSALDVLREVRRDVTYSCRQGFCGSCRVRVVAGTPDHRGRALSDRDLEEGAFLPCVSRSAAGRLVLDL